MPLLALSMIVRDAELYLGDCLESIRGIVDEILVADTGSTDQTPEIARRMGARVITIPWKQDFSRARNLALEATHAEWVLVLDADEQLDASARSLRSLLPASPFAGYQVPIRNYVLSRSDRVWDRPAAPNDSDLAAARPYPAYVEHENVRLFRRRNDIYFVGRVHETVGPRILACGGKLGRAAFSIHHFGLVASQEIRIRKAHFYRELGRQKIQEMSGDGQAHFELGLLEFDNFHNYAEALQCFEQACRLSPRFSTAWFFAGLTLAQLGRHEESLQYLKQAEAIGHSGVVVSEAKADVLYNLGRFDEARRGYSRAWKRFGTSELESKLGLAEVRLGRNEQGLNHLRRAVEREPQAEPCHDRLIVALTALNRLADAANAAERKLNLVSPTVKHYLRAAAIRAHAGQWERAGEILQAGLLRFPEAADLQNALASIQTEVYKNSILNAPSEDGEDGVIHAHTGAR
jgi:glycosyltransferase involved in cell wall biosynthesis